MSSDLDLVRRALSDRYRIERELGRGGMATVYLAEDIRHGRKVAVKVLRPEIADTLAPERFLQEVHLTAGLTHPNIVQLYDSGAEQGCLYYVMPFLEGESLRRKLDRVGPLPVEEAVAIARTVALALEHAHRHGVVHRDIKPDNIMLQDGVPLVTDFGIALAVATLDDRRMTATGLSLGTPTYMSPEQATGDRRVNASSDIYSVGALLYEMLVGAPPFTGPTFQALIARIATEKPTPVRVLRDTVPQHVADAVDKALAKLPADRFSSAEAFANALAVQGAVSPRAASPRPRSTTFATIGLVALLVASGLLFLRKGATPNGAPAAQGASGAADTRPAIAVLSFADLSPGRDQSYFSEGVSEEILNALSRIRNLRVAARATAFTYTGANLDLRKVGRELGVGYLLGGSVRKAGDRVRISAELVAAADGFRVWSGSYDRELKDIFAIQSEIASAITDSLRVPLGLAAEELAPPTADTAGHDLYLQARQAFRQRGRGIEVAIQLLERSIQRDSSWAPAWAALAEAWLVRPIYASLAGESRDSLLWVRSVREGERAARRALQLDPRQASAHVALGSVHRMRRDWDASIQELLAALAIDPDNHEAHHQYAETLWIVARVGEALREAERAVSIDPAPIRWDVLGFTLYINGRSSEAEAALQKGMAIDTAGDVHYLRHVMGRIMLFDGRYREALSRYAFYLGDTASYRMQGEALAARDSARMPPPNREVYAQTWMLLGYPDRAIDVLRKETASRFSPPYNHVDPHLAPLWSNRRFQDEILAPLKLRGRAIVRD